jgi:hypothetical protein
MSESGVRQWRSDGGAPSDLLEHVPDARESGHLVGECPLLSRSRA